MITFLMFVTIGLIFYIFNLAHTISKLEKQNANLKELINRHSMK